MVWGNRVSCRIINNIALWLVQEQIELDHQCKNEIPRYAIDRFNQIFKFHIATNKLLLLWIKHSNAKLNDGLRIWDVVPAPTLREYHWYIVDYIYQSSKFTLHLIEQ
jgi:hypothetical protein